MALIKHSAVQTLARDAIVLDLGDLQRQADHLIAAARRRAEEIIREAEAQRERLVTGAAERGYEEGMARGLAEGAERGEAQGRAAALETAGPQLAALQQQWAAALEQFLAARERMLHEAETDVLRLAVAIAEKVTKRVVELDPQVVAGQLGAALALIVRPSALRVTVHPEDRGAAAAALPELLRRFPIAGHAELVEDAALARGSCIVRTSGAAGQEATLASGEIDASIDSQLRRIVDALLPARGAPPAADPPPRGEPSSP